MPGRVSSKICGLPVLGDEIRDLTRLAAVDPDAAAQATAAPPVLIVHPHCSAGWVSTLKVTRAMMMVVVVVAAAAVAVAVAVAAAAVAEG